MTETETQEREFVAYSRLKKAEKFVKFSAHKNRFTFAILSERPCIMQYRQKIINYESVLNAVLK